MAAAGTTYDGELAAAATRDNGIQTANNERVQDMQTSYAHYNTAFGNADSTRTAYETAVDNAEAGETYANAAAAAEVAWVAQLSPAALNRAGALAAAARTEAVTVAQATRDRNVTVAALAQFCAGQLAAAARDRDEAYGDAEKAWADAVWPAWATYVGIEASANAQWVDAESHAYAAYEQDVAAAQVALVSAIAPANVTYGQDAAQAWSDYHVTMTGIDRDICIASAQLNVAQVNAADPSTFWYIYPQSGSSGAPMMAGVSALPWAYDTAIAVLGRLGEPEYTPPPNPPTSSSPGSSSSGSTPATPSGFWGSLGDSFWSMGQTYVGIWQWGCSWFDGNADYITTFQNAYDYGPLGQTQNSSGVYYYRTRGALAVSTIATAMATGTLIWEAAGLPMFTISTSQGHFVYGVTQAGETTWYHWFGGTELISGGSAEYFASHATWWTTWSGNPIFFPAAAGAITPVPNCFLTCVRAWFAGLTGL